MAEKLTSWDFVTKWYPNYYSSDTIAEHNDLAKLVDKEYEEDEDDSAYKSLMEDYGGDINNPKILADYNASLVSIYEDAMEAYMETQTPEDANDKIYELLGQYTANDAEDYDTIIWELRQALQKSPNDTVDFASDTITMWQKVENRFTVKEFCDLVGISDMPMM